MNTTEHLLTCLIEECGEVIHAATKALRFGLKDKHPKRGDAPNDQLLAEEFEDLLGVYRMLQDKGVLRAPSVVNVDNKQAKVRKFMHWAKETGALSNDDEGPGGM